MKITAARAAIALNAIAISYLFWQADYYLHREPPMLSFPQLPFKLKYPGEPIFPGDAVQITVERCSSMSQTTMYDIVHTLVNLDTGDRWILPSPPPIPIEPGCQTSVSALNEVNSWVRPGHYMFIGAGRSRGTLRTVDVKWMTEPFYVVARPTLTEEKEKK